MMQATAPLSTGLGAARVGAREVSCDAVQIAAARLPAVSLQTKVPVRHA